MDNPEAVVMRRIAQERGKSPGWLSRKAKWPRTRWENVQKNNQLFTLVCIDGMERLLRDNDITEDEFRELAAIAVKNAKNVDTLSDEHLEGLERLRNGRYLTDVEYRELKAKAPQSPPLRDVSPKPHPQPPGRSQSGRGSRRSRTPAFLIYTLVVFIGGMVAGVQFGPDI